MKEALASVVVVVSILGRCTMHVGRRVDSCVAQYMACGHLKMSLGGGLGRWEGDMKKICWQPKLPVDGHSNDHLINVHARIS